MMNKCTEVKVYTASAECLEDPALFEAWLRRMPAMRRQKAEKPKNPGVRKLSLGAGALLVYALRDCAGYPDDTQLIRMEESEHGKPYLPDDPQLHFSLSHSADRVMCAVSGAEVGCDVEEAGTEEADVRRIAYISRCLTESEREASLADPANFYRIWTLKESFLKLTGQGLQIPLSSFEITLDPTRVRQDILPGDVVLKEYGQIGGCQCACMAQGGRFADEMICVDLKEALF